VAVHRPNEREGQCIRQLDVFVDVQDVQVQRRCPFEKIAVIVNDVGFWMSGIGPIRPAQINNRVAPVGLGGS
jgi:hypothetical protein